MNLRMLGLCGLLAGCPAAPRGPESLIDHSLWERVEAEGTPFAALAPADPPFCPDLAVYAAPIPTGEPATTIELSQCGYVVLQQPSRVEVLDGDVGFLRLWHDQITLSVPEGLHLGVSVGEEVWWELGLPAPGSSGLEFPDLPGRAAHAIGEPVTFFLLLDDNGERHGANTLDLIDLTRRDPEWVEQDE